MPILRKLKSLLGVGDGEDDAERDVTVTVEHDPENEAAVKGADVGDDATAAPESESESGAARGSDASEATDTAQEPDGTGDDVEIPDAEERTTGSTDAASDEPETETDATESEEEVDAADATDGEPVDVLDGIGPAYAQRLGDAGVDTVAELADADAAELSDATEIAEGRIQNWIDQAAEY